MNVDTFGETQQPLNRARDLETTNDILDLFP